MIQVLSRIHGRAFRAICSTGLVVGLTAVSAQYAQAQTPPAKAKESSVTVYGGYRFGGSLTDANTGATVDLKDDASAALAIDIGLDRQTQLQFFYSYHNTALTSGSFSPQVNNFGLTLHNYHIGGTYFLAEAGRGLYFMGGIGGTTATPDLAGLNSETFFSGNLGIGWMVPLGKHVGLRFEARGYGILINNDSAMFCSGGCVVSIKGDTLTYGEALVGLSIRF